MFHSRRDRENIDDRPEISWQHAIIIISVIFFVAIPLGWLLAIWTGPWAFKALETLTHWIFH